MPDRVRFRAGPVKAVQRGLLSFLLSFFLPKQKKKIKKKRTGCVNKVGRLLRISHLHVCVLWDTVSPEKGGMEYLFVSKETQRWW